MNALPTMRRWLSSARATAKFAAYHVIARTSPPRLWCPILRLFDPRPSARIPEERIARFLDGYDVSMPASQILRTGRLHYHEMKVQTLASTSWTGFKPAVRVTGEQAVKEALARGKGAILWTSYFKEMTMMEGMGYAQAGLNVHLVSHPTHGSGPLPPVVKTLMARQVQAAENRYYAGRIVIDANAFLKTMRQVSDVLKDNGVVAIRVLRRANRVIDLPFLNGRIQFSTGPIELARSTGAALIPLFTVRTGPTEYEIRFGTPLDIASQSDRIAAEQKTARAYLDQLEPYVLQSPETWAGWSAAMEEASPDTDARPAYTTGRRYQPQISDA